MGPTCRAILEIPTLKRIGGIEYKCNVSQLYVEPNLYMRGLNKEEKLTLHYLNHEQQLELLLAAMAVETNVKLLILNVYSLNKISPELFASAISN